MECDRHHRRGDEHTRDRQQRDAPERVRRLSRSVWNDASNTSPGRSTRSTSSGVTSTVWPGRKVATANPNRTSATVYGMPIRRETSATRTAAARRAVNSSTVATVASAGMELGRQPPWIAGSRLARGRVYAAGWPRIPRVRGPGKSSRAHGLRPGCGVWDTRMAAISGGWRMGASLRVAMREWSGPVARSLLREVPGHVEDDLGGVGGAADQYMTSSLPPAARGTRDPVRAGVARAGS